MIKVPLNKIAAFVILGQLSLPKNMAQVRKGATATKSAADFITLDSFIGTKSCAYAPIALYHALFAMRSVKSLGLRHRQPADNPIERAQLC